MSPLDSKEPIGTESDESSDSGKLKPVKDGQPLGFGYRYVKEAGSGQRAEPFFPPTHPQEKSHLKPFPEPDRPDTYHERYVQLDRTTQPHQETLESKGQTTGEIDMDEYESLLGVFSTASEVDDATKESMRRETAKKIDRLLAELRIKKRRR